jgi:hypothetical protein
MPVVAIGSRAGLPLVGIYTLFSTNAKPYKVWELQPTRGGAVGRDNRIECFDCSLDGWVEGYEDRDEDDSEGDHQGLPVAFQKFQESVVV